MNELFVVYARNARSDRGYTTEGEGFENLSEATETARTMNAQEDVASPWAFFVGRVVPVEEEKSE